MRYQRYQTALSMNYQTQLHRPQYLRPHQIPIKMILIVSGNPTTHIEMTVQSHRILPPLILTRIIQLRHQRKLKRNHPRFYIVITIVSRYWQEVK
jgi:hypothetical protein